MLALIPVTPDPIAFHLGPIPVHWYGVCYAIGITAAYLAMTRVARSRGLDPGVVDNGIVIVTVAGLVGGRMYHVIDEWDRYSRDLPSIVLPPYAGLGVLGGIITGTVALVVVLRVWNESFWRWADVVAVGAFLMQAVARWGNFFNQELYGPPTDLPWGIAIDCEHRASPWPCAGYPEAGTGFHPLFLYESVSGVLGVLTLLWIARRWGPRMRPGDLFLGWLVWYSLVRLALETLRADVWTVGGVPTAVSVCTVLAVGSLALLAWRHRPNAEDAERWGDPPAPSDPAEDGPPRDRARSR